MRAPNNQDQPPHPSLALGYKPRPGGESEVERIVRALQVVAGVIADQGEEYLPIFERLEAELIKCMDRQKILARALAISKGALDADPASPDLAHKLSHIFSGSCDANSNTL